MRDSGSESECTRKQKDVQADDQRRNDGWYRRQASGAWSFAAPVSGTVTRGQVATGPKANTAAAANVNRIAPNPKLAPGRTAARERVPDLGDRVQAQQVADLERQYYARSIAQMRNQYSRPANVSRPVRGGGRRR